MKLIDSKRVLKVLRNEKRYPVKYKARLCARGFRLIQGLDYKETFAPVIRYAYSSPISCSCHAFRPRIGAVRKSAFLYGDLQEEIFMEVPVGIRQVEGENNVCRLLKVRYGLKQAARCWNANLTRVLKNLGLEQCESEKCIFSDFVNYDKVIIAFSVDDGLVVAKSQESLQIVIDALSE